MIVRDYESFGPPIITLACGAPGFREGCGYRCQNCFTIYGSIACPCTRDKPTPPQAEGKT